MKTIILFVCAFFVITISICSKRFRKMSTIDLKIISVNPSYLPDENSLNKTKQFLTPIFRNRKVEFIETEHIEFVDQGSNFEKVSCNYCGKKLDNDLWQHQMDIAYKTNFEDLHFITPCCRKRTSLNDLKYDWPAGFGKFVIDIANPGIDLNDKQFAELQTILHTNMRRIWAHY